MLCYSSGDGRAAALMLDTRIEVTPAGQAISQGDKRFARGKGLIVEGRAYGGHGRVKALELATVTIADGNNVGRASHRRDAAS